MRARHFTCALIGLLAGGTPISWSSETDEFASRAAHYYAEGLQAPLLQIRTGAAIVETCKKRIRWKCSKRHREAADKARYMLEYLDALTLFPQRPASDPAATLTQYADVVAALDIVNDRLLGMAREYDLALFARYAATLRACPPENLEQYRESLKALRQLEVQALGHASTGDEEDMPQLQERLAAMSAPECAATRDFGELLMTMMSAKLEPWRRGADAVPGADATRSIASEFLFEVATELEVTVHPDSRGTFEAIAQRLHESQPAKRRKPGLSLSW